MNKDQANCLKFSDINIGDVYQFSKIITEKDVETFSDLTGDFNPLHVDKEFGKKSYFKRNILQGMFAASLFSTLIGMHCPGRNGLYLSQTLNFKHPIFYPEKIDIKGTVINKNDSIKIITLKTEIIKNNKVLINGEAKIKFLDNSND